ncbi:uncharacterized protein si:dkeyp-55f12.3 [Kryptolebias marmoratus]|uniref:uncharacterized protein si:dkeyp-55f12.3 n=1 Tax=Kryptolebias marmoratus TaxID=37003 RepID=UPI0018AD0466|nr:uncharacterized protein si:dkeyp-55f12.3 [Kryptolebias marmoratus]
METVFVCARLRLRDGQNRTFSVPVGNNLGSLNSGISELNTNVSQLLSELVERERARGGCARGDEEEGSEENDEDCITSELQPAAKRSKNT